MDKDLEQAIRECDLPRLELLSAHPMGGVDVNGHTFRTGQSPILGLGAEDLTAYRTLARALAAITQTWWGAYSNIFTYTSQHSYLKGAEYPEDLATAMKDPDRWFRRFDE